ncbi:MAG: Lrp/AsnC ligand binding domain-containing protein [Candidatus Thermoplasmatota archaeon]|nr:Lrp/AsnC family transcriptional regulator [Euryarchaeota archaeon]MBU4071212.1 Lrp/AsnC ligand binding domain-containing protein [Candidatus Thermoplasmatota archaeon]MBU4145061.1 Lrp/AsnC ligand binding domain-containing protein [Candidatus Thermoplasmatota archaeon]MBU4592779.1 Lrp/AsnC ligand binding domain-containing protein [Candidatus Thermoplasmatota archaeon]
MARGFVLIDVEPGKEMEAFRGFKRVKGVVEATPLLGDIDFLLIVEAETANDIAKIVINHIRKVVGVVSTKTLVEDEFLKHFEDLI